MKVLDRWCYVYLGERAGSEKPGTMHCYILLLKYNRVGNLFALKYIVNGHTLEKIHKNVYFIGLVKLNRVIVLQLLGSMIVPKEVQKPGCLKEGLYFEFYQQYYSQS